MTATQGLHRVSHEKTNISARDGTKNDGRTSCNDPKLERSALRPGTELRPGRRRVPVSPISVLHLLVCSMVLLSTFCIPAGATKSFEERRRARYGKFAMELPTVQLVDPEPHMFKPGDIVYDTRFPVPGNFLRRRDGIVFGSGSSNSARPTATGAQTTPQRPLRFHSTAVASPASPTASILPPLDSSSSPSGAAPSSIVTAPDASSELPKPFDAGLGNNYTQPNCPVFINNFLRNDTFTSCLPFSLLLQVSVKRPVSFDRRDQLTANL